MRLLCFPELHPHKCIWNTLFLKVPHSAFNEYIFARMHCFSSETDLWPWCCWWHALSPADIRKSILFTRYVKLLRDYMIIYTNLMLIIFTVKKHIYANRECTFLRVFFAPHVSFLTSIFNSHTVFFFFFFYMSITVFLLFTYQGQFGFSLYDSSAWKM